MGIGTSQMTRSTPLVWKHSGGGMNPLRPLKQTSLPRGQAQEGGSPTGAMTPPSTTSSQPLLTPTLGTHEIREIICETLDQVYALRFETLQEIGFIWEVDRALAKSVMVEFLRLQLIVGDDLNTSLWAMYADLEVTVAELVKDMDIAAQNSTALPSKNPAIGVALHRFTELVRLKLPLPLAQVDTAREDMQRFLHHHLEELRSQMDMKNLIDNLSQRIAAHQSRAHQIVFSEPMENSEVLLQVILGVAVDQPVESNFFPGILEGLLGRISITAHGEKNPPTSAKEGAARLWASAVLNAVQKMEKRQVRPQDPQGCLQDCISMRRRISSTVEATKCLESSQTLCSYPTWSTQCTN